MTKLGSEEKSLRFTGERLNLNPRTDDPTNLRAGTAWIRGDLDDDQLATFRYYDGTETVDLPILPAEEDVDEEGGISKALRVVVAGEEGFIPIGPREDATHPEWTIQHAGDMFGFTDNFAAIPDNLIERQYFGTDAGIYSVDTESESVEWTSATDNVYATSPVIYEGTIIIAGNDSNLRSVDAETGDEIWLYDLDDNTDSSPVVIDGTVYIGANDDIHAVDASTGEGEWTYDAGGAVNATPAVVDDTIYMGTNDDRVFALDIDTQDEIWSFTSDFDTEFFGDPSVTTMVGVGEGKVFAGFNEKFIALSIANGEEQWGFETDESFRSAPAVYDGVVYVGCRDDNLYALDAETGDEEWSFETNGRVESGPAIRDGIVYAGSNDDNIYAINTETGNEEWSFDTGDNVTSTPAVVDDTVYVGSFSNDFYAFEAETGDVNWSLSTENSVRSTSAPGGSDGWAFCNRPGVVGNTDPLPTDTSEWSGFI